MDENRVQRRRDPAKAGPAEIRRAVRETDPAADPAVAEDLIAGWVADGKRRPSPPAVVPPPAQPLRVARKLVDDLYSDRAGLMLRDHRGDFYLYDGTCWPELDGRLVRAASYRWLEHAVYEKHTKDGTTLEHWDPTRYKINNLIDALRAVVMLEAGEPPVWTDGRQEDPPATETISMQNGLLHVPTRRLHEHTPRFFTHHALPFVFNPDAPEPTRWLEFLTQLWPDDPSAIRALQEMFGYILGGDTRQQKIFLLVGPRRGGKGTIGRVLTGLLGAHNVAAPTMASLGTNFGLQPLIGKPLGLISDARLSGRPDGQVVVERLLSISGEDSLTIDRKYRDPWTGRLPTRLMILTNELPRLSDSSGALASRFIVFVLTRSFLGREDPALTDKLLMEATGIFNWALEGLDRLNERGYFAPPRSGKEAIQQLEDLSSPVSAFVRDRCSVGTDQRVPVDDLWTAWRAWCEQENRHPGTKAVFGRNLKAAVPMVRKTRPRDDGNRFNAYEGVGLGARNTLAGHRDHHDHEGRSRQRSPSGHGIRSQQEASNHAAGHGGHGTTAPYAQDEDRETVERESIRIENAPAGASLGRGPGDPHGEQPPPSPEDEGELAADLDAARRGRS